MAAATVQGRAVTQTPTPTPKKKSDLIPRVITAVVAVPLLLWLLLAGPPWAFAILIAAAVVVAAWELVSMVQGGEGRLAQVITCIACLGLAAAIYLTSSPTQAPDGHVVLATASGGILAIFIAHLFSFKEIEKVSLHVGTGALALVYCAVMPTMLALLFRDAGDDGPAWVLMSMAVVWGSDTGAYFAGRAFGKHKLAPRVSPKKTIEGAVGGLLTSVVAVFVFKYTLLPQLELWQVFVVAIPANILGQIGDLCESVIKRAHGVKDSGVIIYGHGGLLDRIDALIFAIPWFYVCQHYLV